jgi:hypothetical protein
MDAYKQTSNPFYGLCIKGQLHYGRHDEAAGMVISRCYILRDFDSSHFVAKLHIYLLMLQILGSNSYDTVPLLGPRYWTIVRPPWETTIPTCCMYSDTYPKDGWVGLFFSL